MCLIYRSISPRSEIRSDRGYSSTLFWWEWSSNGAISEQYDWFLQPETFAHEFAKIRSLRVKNGDRKMEIVLLYYYSR